MKVVLQRVKKASVFVAGEEKAAIGKGFLLLVGIEKNDTDKSIEEMAVKISKLRVFEDDNEKMNLSLADVKGEILSVPQFTLLGNTDKGNRPGFDDAAPPEEAVTLWQKFDDILKDTGISVGEGMFGAHMDVVLINDGPVTFVIGSGD